MNDSLDDCDEYLDEEDDQLVFDTEIGKLIRPGLSRRSPSKPNLEEGQSEEEDGYQPSIADEKPPSTGSLAACWLRHANNMMPIRQNLQRLLRI